MIDNETAAIENMKHSIGLGMKKAEVNKRYFGSAPEGSYVGFGKGKTPQNIHDLTMSASQKKRLYGIGKAPIEDTGDVVNARLESDSKSGLIRELVEETHLTRMEATQIIDNWMQKNGLIEVDDPELGRIVIPKAKEVR